MHGHEIGCRQQIRKAGWLNAKRGHGQFFHEGIESLHVQAKGAGAMRGGAGNATKADEAECLAHQARNLQQLRAAFTPAAFTHHAVLFNAAPMRGQQQHHGVIGDFFDEGIGAIRHRNALRGRRRHIHIINANRTQRDDAALLQRLDHLGIELHALGINRISLAGLGDEILFSRLAFDDFNTHAFQRFKLIIIAAAGGGEGRRRGRQDGEFCHIRGPFQLIP